MTKQNLKNTIKTLVTEKVSATRSRVEYKATNRPRLRTDLSIDKYCSELQSIDWGRSELKDSIRHHLLAYALVRGRPYASQEARCGADNAPGVYAVANISGVPEEVVEAWLKGEAVLRTEPAAEAAE